MSMPAEHISQAMTLEELLAGIVAAPELPVADLTTDSRRVGKGSLFLACPGLRTHGLDYVDDAAARGAIAVAYDSATSDTLQHDPGVAVVPVPFLCDRLGVIANRFFQTPSADLAVTGITGTNGKSTVAWLVAQTLSGLGQRCAYAGTLGYGVSELRRDDDMTSPDVIETHRRLAGFRDQGAACAAIEVSSHALDQGRVAGVRFDAAIFTNLSRDHLDYHGSMAAYGAAKAKLFEAFDVRHRIVNVDSGFGVDLAARCRGNVVTVATRADFDAPATPWVHLRARSAHAGGSRVAVRSSWGDDEFDLPLIGGFNVANAACVLGLLLARGETLDAACRALARVSAPPGRMETVPVDTGPAVYVDYAHTPDALAAAIAAVRPHTNGTLWCVFGCGGDRDAGKRPEMGRIAAELADRVVVTNDNPRSEPPSAIVADIMAGIADAGFDSAGRVDVIEDRAAAIASTIARAADGDAILIAGKGHENYQIIGGRRLPFSDFDIAAAALAGRERPDEGDE